MVQKQLQEQADPEVPPPAARTPIPAGLITIIAVAFSLFQLYSNGLALLPSIWQYGIHLGFALALGFLAFPAFKSGPKILIVVDLVLVTLSLTALAYILMRYDAMAVRFGIFFPSETLSALVLVLLVLELTRRVLGLPLVILAILFIVYAYFGNFIPGVFGHAGYSAARISSYLILTTDGVFGTALGVAATLISVFIIFGAFLNVTGCGAWFIDVANCLAGRTAGGPAKMAVIGSALMGTISGSAAANVATSGAFTIPLMRAAGYRPAVAGGIEAAASTGGMILPPVMGAGAFVMAELLGVPYSTIALSALIPALLYFLAIFLQVDFVARRHKLRGLRDEEIVSWQVVKGTAYRAIPLIVLIYLIFIERYSAIYAAFWSIGSIILVGFLFGGLRRLKPVIEALREAAIAMLPITAACATAGVVVGVLMLTGLGLRLSSIMISMAGGNLPLLLVLTMIASLILGMGVPATAAYIILAVLAAPALIQLGVDQLAAHMFVFYFGVISNITPPVAVAAFVAAGIAGESPNRVGLEAFRIGSVAFLIPFMFVYGPELLLMNPDPVRLAVSLVTATVGVICLAAGMQGWLLARLVAWERIILLVAAILFFVPHTLPDLVGMVGLLLILARAHHRKRHPKVAD